MTDIELVRSWSTGFIPAQAVYALAALGIADALAARPHDAQALASELRLHEPSLRQFLQAVAAWELVHVDATGVATLTPRGRLLAASTPGTLYDEVLFVGTLMAGAFGQLTTALQTGTVAFDHAYGASFATVLGQQPAAAAHFNQYMRQLSEQFAPLFVANIPLHDGDLFVDLGGGVGTLLAAILQRYPHSRGVLVDQAEAEAQAIHYLHSQGVAARCAVQVTDITRQVPVGDTYVLCQVLHDLDDTQALAVLRAIRAQIPATGQVLIVEKLLVDGVTPSVALAARHLKMLAMTGGKERTVGAFRDLLATAGFGVHGPLPLAPAPDAPPLMDVLVGTPR